MNQPTTQSVGAVSVEPTDQSANLSIPGNPSVEEQQAYLRDALTGTVALLQAELDKPVINLAAFLTVLVVEGEAPRVDMVGSQHAVVFGTRELIGGIGAMVKETNADPRLKDMPEVAVGLFEMGLVGHKQPAPTTSEVGHG